ncbi:hypothetical protein SLE2022_244670 [Rubroshorea leprosula]
MVVLPLPKISVPISCLAPTTITTGKYLSTTTYKAVRPNPNSVGFREVSVGQGRQLVADDQTWKMGRGENYVGGIKRLRLEREVENVIFRLEAVAKRVVEVETEKFLSKVKGTISCEEREMVEETSWEIMRQFLEKPIRYLRSCSDGCVEEKLKVVEMIIDGMVEKSCLEKKA